MVPFLKQVADHYIEEIAGAGITGQNAGRKLCFVFPNRRAEVFFRLHLSQAMKEHSEALKASGVAAHPVLLPAMYQMNSLFSLLGGGTPVASRVPLLIELYKCWKDLNPNAEPLDEFIFWGDVILADFDDTDKYLVNPKALFTNVREFRELQGNSYLSEVQKKALEQFLGHFKETGGKKVKTGFLNVWNLLSGLYTAFNDALKAKGMAYEGMVYRNVAERLAKAPVGAEEPVREMIAKVAPDVEKLVFVGLNALNECERRLLARLRDAGMAEFCWDYPEKVGFLINARHNRSSFFMRDNVSEFPPSWTPTFSDEGPDGRPVLPEFNVLSVPSATGQVKQVPAILRTIAGEGESLGSLELGAAAGKDTAIILPDETMLPPLLNSIPEDIANVNVTMGYPIRNSSFHALMLDILSMQLHLRQKKDGSVQFYWKQVRSIFTNPIFRKVTGQAGSEAVHRIVQEAKYYIPAADLRLSGDGRPAEIFSTIFEPKSTVDELKDYLKKVVTVIAMALKGDDTMNQETEFAKCWYVNVNALDLQGLEVKPVTYVKLVSSLAASSSVPFQGEPLKGLQVMGPLETRALDFSNLVILSANEGVFPRYSVSASFIPPELRKGFGLPTYEFQDAVWAYYFYRMILRARKVWMVYDSRAEKMRPGEESRYVLQLMYDFQVPVRRYVAVQGDSLMKAVDNENLAIPKSAEDVAKVMGSDFTLSPSSVKQWLSCKAQFYYSKICGLELPEDVSENLDSAMTGTVFHNTMYCIYAGGEAGKNADGSLKNPLMGDMPVDRRAEKWLKDNVLSRHPDYVRDIDAAYIKGWLEDAAKGGAIRSRINSLICQQLHSEEVTGRNLVTADLISSYVKKTLERDLELTGNCDGGVFRILGLEQFRDCRFRVENVGPDSIEHDFRILGYIDREDTYMENGRRVVRIIDYKTGKAGLADMRTSYDMSEKGAHDAAGIADGAFGYDKKFKPKHVLQLYIYDKFEKDRIHRLYGDDVDIRIGIYSCVGMFSEAPIALEVDPGFVEEADKRLSGTIREMADPQVMYERTDDTKICTWCDFRNICGR